MFMCFHVILREELPGAGQEALMFFLHVFIKLEDKESGEHSFLMFEMIDFLLIVDKTFEDFHAVIINVGGISLLQVLHRLPDKVAVGLLTFEEDFCLFDQALIDVFH
jgi:hypothetical protein